MSLVVDLAKDPRRPRTYSIFLDLATVRRIDLQSAFSFSTFGPLSSGICSQSITIKASSRHDRCGNGLTADIQNNVKHWGLTLMSECLNAGTSVRNCRTISRKQRQRSVLFIYTACLNRFNASCSKLLLFEVYSAILV